MSSATEQTSHGPDSTAGVPGPYWVHTTATEYQVLGRHGAIIRRYPLSMHGAAEADVQLLGSKEAQAAKIEAARVERIRDAATDLLEALIGLLVSRDDEAVSLAQAAIKKAEGR